MTQKFTFFILICFMISGCNLLPQKIPTANTTKSTLTTQAAEPQVESSATEFQTSPSVQPVITSTPTAKAQTSDAGLPKLILNQQFTGLAIANGKIFLSIGRASENFLESYELRTGKLLWSVNTTGLVCGADEKNVYLNQDDQILEAVDGGDGHVLWQTPSDQKAKEFSLLGIKDVKYVFLRTIIFNNNKEIFKITVIDRTTGVVVKAIDSSTFLSTQIISQVGSFVTFIENNNFGYEDPFMWNKDSGEIKVSVQVACNQVLLKFPPIISNTEEIEGLDLSTGEHLWQLEKTQANMFINCPPYAIANAFILGQDTPPRPIPLTNIDSQSDMIYFREVSIDTLGQTHIIAFDEKSGKLAWKSDPIPFFYTPTGTNWLGENNHRVIFGNLEQHKTSVYSLPDGHLLWESLDAGINWLAGGNESILIGIAGEIEPSPSTNEVETLTADHFIAFDNHTGKILWQLDAGGKKLWEVKVIDNSLVYLEGESSNQSWLHLIDLRSGKEVLSTNIGEKSTVIDVEGLLVNLYYGSIGNIQVIDPGGLLTH